MKFEDSHLSDQQLLLDIETELTTHDEKPVHDHLEKCWKCRTRRQELESAIAGFVRAQQQEFDSKIPPAAGPRAMLKAQLAQVSVSEPNSLLSWHGLDRRFAWALAGTICGLIAVISFVVHPSQTPQRTPVVSVPDSRLTPGAALLLNRQMVCAGTNTKNKAVPVALQRKVFEEYGIVGEPRAYEVDYLITPALGGADDIHNLWPHSYSATVWNARVKDALEDRLREMVCDGSLDLAEAQRDIATNWIAAYKKYFHTDEPLLAHRSGERIQ
jgi:hypothetical protein